MQSKPDAPRVVPDLNGTRFSIAHLASEMAPMVQVGGLAAVIDGLARAQARRGHRVTVVLPGHRGLAWPHGWRVRDLATAEVPWGMGREPARFALAEGEVPNLRVLVVHHAGERRFFDRDGVYDDPATGAAYPDNAERYLFFARAALEGLRHLDERLDILHAHDHQAAWAPCFARTHEAQDPTFRDLATVFTLHSLAYQGIHDSWVLGLAGFALDQFAPGSPFEFWGRVNDMKVGLSFADALTTVSPRYAQEIQSNGEFGRGLEGVLRRRGDVLRGVLNGIDEATWNPALDPRLPRTYDADHLEGKSANRAALLQSCGFLPSERPIVAVVSRLVAQKGWELVEQAATDLEKIDASLVVLGSGEPRYEALFRRFADQHPERVHYRAGRDDAFTHLIAGGSDLLLMPSRDEPCGMEQMVAQRYGAAPVVHAVGGLADTVEEFDLKTGTGTGFLFQRYEAAEMVAALKRGLAIRRQPALWAKLQRNAMQRDFSWRIAADAYDRIYADARARVAREGAPTLESVKRLIEVRG